MYDMDPTAGGRDDPRERRRRRRLRQLLRRKRVAWTPWLLIRYASADNGTGRPIPDETVFWTSPDIWIESSDALGNAVAGEPNFVHANVFNLGKALARPTRVDFYWGDPSLGLGPAQMHFIGTEWVHIPAHGKRDVRCSTPWIPALVNNGHECVIVNCTCDISDPIKAPFQTRLDRHVGQRNLTVIHAQPGETINLAIAVNNLAPMFSKTHVGARIEHLAASAAGGISPSGLQIRSQLSERIAVVASAESTRHFSDLLRAGSARASSAFGGMVLHDATMEPFEQRRLDLEFGMPADARSGDTVVLHVMQEIAGLPVGGYTVIATVPAEPPPV